MSANNKENEINVDVILELLQKKYPSLGDLDQHSKSLFGQKLGGSVNNPVSGIYLISWARKWTLTQEEFIEKSGVNFTEAQKTELSQSLRTMQSMEFVTIRKTYFIGTTIFLDEIEDGTNKITIARYKSLASKLFSKNYTNELHSFFEKELGIKIKIVKERE